ncbi:MAG: hypothetical protein IKM06_07490 [Clostridia bacterium]|nr:hypothetical protein [Clostridia bacterium]
MQVLLLVISIMAVVGSSTIYNKVGKSYIREDSDTYVFNVFQHLASFLIFFFIAITQKASLTAILFGFVFGIVTVLSGVSKLLALRIGPMYITTLIGTSSMIIPTVVGTFFPGAEPLSIYKLIAIIALIFCIFITTFKKSDGSFSVKWLIYCLLSFVLGGMIGVLQKLFRETPYGDQQSVFLAAAFFASFAYSAIMLKKKTGKNKITVSTNFITVSVICGICAYLCNHINLYLSGIMSSQIFFPIVNGVPLIACSVIAFTVFKEKFSIAQLLGLIGGIISLVLICLV